MKGANLLMTVLSAWLEELDQQFFCNRIRALQKCWTKCVSVARDC